MRGSDGYICQRRYRECKVDSFEHHVNRMATAYNKMKNSIEEKYAEQDYELEYYVTESGKIEELTKEKNWIC